jgi:hypothetical protein
MVKVQTYDTYVRMYLPVFRLSSGGVKSKSELGLPQIIIR